MLNLENEKILVSIGQGRGARVDQFLDKETNRDWVWKNEPENFDRNSSLGILANFDDSWAGGWEEVFPNDAATEIEGYHLGDHGELWRSKWQRCDDNNNPLELSFKINCETYPMSCMKRFSLHPEEAQLQIDYEIKNLGQKKLPFIFKFHPALNIEEGDRYLMPPSTMVPVALEFSRILGKDLETSYPVGLSYEGKRVTIDTVKPYDGFSREFVRLHEFDSGQAGIYSSRGQKKLSMKFNSKDFSYIWLFQSYGGFRGHHVSMIEPSNSGNYDLLQASEENSCGFLLPDEVKRFRIEAMIQSL